MKISPFKEVVIIGVGLIGGSIGLGLKKYARGVYIIGIGRNIKRLRLAEKRGAIDRASLELKDVRGQGLVILAQPVSIIKKTLIEISPFLEKGQVVIDVGGTKEGILNIARRSMPCGVSFIGTHPLAGSEKTGIQAASPDLFCGSECIIIKDRTTSQKSFLKVKTVFNILGAEVISMTASEHDKLMTAISHLPHLVSQTLVGTVGRHLPEALNLASTGFRDTTRIAESSPEIWRDIFIENKDNILSFVSLYEKELKKIRRLIDKGRKDTLLSYLTEIKNIREKL